jgi:fructokinase
MIYTLGESLMDIIFDENGKIESRAGGAMLNLSASLGRCGQHPSLISELGDDKIADKIISFLNDNHINTSLINCYKGLSTSIALAFLDDTGIPSYSFHKSYPDKRQLKTPQNINSADILVFGSIYSLDEQIRLQLKHIIEDAKSKNAMIIYDPNIRHAHHLKNRAVRKALYENITLAGIVKGSDEDFNNIFGTVNDNLIIKEIRKLNQQAMIFITKGANGAKLIYDNIVVVSDALKTEVKSTIGAGDNFTAGIVYYLSTNGIKKAEFPRLEQDTFENMLKTAIEFSSEVCASYDNYISKEFVDSFIVKTNNRGKD